MALSLFAAMRAGLIFPHQSCLKDYHSVKVLIRAVMWVFNLKIYTSKQSELSTRQFFFSELCNPMKSEKCGVKENSLNRLN